MMGMVQIGHQCMPVHDGVLGRSDGAPPGPPGITQAVLPWSLSRLLIVVYTVCTHIGAK